MTDHAAWVETSHSKPVAPFHGQTAPDSINRFLSPAQFAFCNPESFLLCERQRERKNKTFLGLRSRALTALSLLQEYCGAFFGHPIKTLRSWFSLLCHNWHRQRLNVCSHLKRASLACRVLTPARTFE
jgi:hypothetical protein